MADGHTTERWPEAEVEKAARALEAIVRHADMPDGESYEQAYIEVTSLAREALVGGEPEKEPCAECGGTGDKSIGLTKHPLTGVAVPDSVPCPSCSATTEGSPRA